jgi:tRNA1(Val) A37 N6-methylase TrmN6
MILWRCLDFQASWDHVMSCPPYQKQQKRGERERKDEELRGNIYAWQSCVDITLI